MALNIILSCLVIVSILNLLLVCDLYGRSAKLATLYEDARRVMNKIHHAMTLQG